MRIYINLHIHTMRHTSIKASIESEYQHRYDSSGNKIIRVHAAMRTLIIIMPKRKTVQYQQNSSKHLLAAEPM